MGERLFVEARDVHLSFGSVNALRGAKLAIPQGAVEGLVGHNGAGKSTLIAVISGIQSADRGTVSIAGEELPQGSVVEAERRGVVLVPQRTQLFNELSVLDNLMIPRRFPTRGTGTIAWADARVTARSALDRVKLDVSLDAPVASLAIPARRSLMIARALLRDPRLLILDEPTGAFTEGEAQLLFDVVRSMVADGLTVLYVSHRLDEVLELAGHVTVMRAGRTVGRVAAADIGRDELVSLILGAAAPEVHCLEATHARNQGTPPVIDLSGVATRKLRGVDLHARGGEVVGLYGLAGAGRTEVLRAIAGLSDTTAGTVSLHDQPLSGSIGQRRAAGVCFLSEDVHGEAALHGLTVRENIAIGVCCGARSTRLPIVSKAAECRLADRALDRVGLDRARMESAIDTLSGGMQQKVMLARSIVNSSTLWLLDEPMTGLDVPTRVELTRLLRGLVADASGGPRAAIVVLSEFEDLAMLCDRVYALRDGRVVAEFVAGEFAEHQLVHAVSFEQAA